MLQATSCFATAYLKLTWWKFWTFAVCILLHHPPLSLPPETESSPPFLLIFPSTSLLGKPPATVFMTHSTHLLCRTVGGRANQNNNLDPVLLEHLSAKCSHKQSKPHAVVMLNFDGWSRGFKMLGRFPKPPYIYSYMWTLNVILPPCGVLFNTAFWC